VILMSRHVSADIYEAACWGLLVQVFLRPPVGGYLWLAWMLLIIGTRARQVVEH